VPDPPEQTVSQQPGSDGPTNGPSSASAPVPPTPTARPSTSSRPPLRRPHEGRLIAGVAAGVAEHVGMDVAIVRILFVVATIFTSGFGVAAYALAWILIPEAAADEATTPTPPGRREVGGRDPMFWVGIGSIVLGVVWLLDRGTPGLAFGPWLRPDRGLLVPLVLIAFGIALWRSSDVQRRSARPAPPAGPPPDAAWRSTSAAATSPTSATAAAPPATSPTTRQEPAVNDDPTRGDPQADRDTTTIPRAGEPGATSGTTPPPGATPPPGFSPPPGSTPPPVGEAASWSPPPVPDRDASILSRSTIGLALVTAGLLWLLRVADVIVLGPGQVLAAALLVIGLGLLVGSWAGRGRGLIGVGLVLLPIVLIAQMVTPQSFALADFRQGVGEAVLTPASVEDLEPTYQIGAGTLTLDLSELELTGTHQVRVQVGFGEAVIVVPDDVTVEVSGQVGGGELTAFDRRSTGLAVDRIILDEVEDEVGRLELDVQVGFGEATVRRAPSDPTSDR
jgi:phage shock protein PspC (stress-responsive transcriptional regulator)